MKLSELHRLCRGIASDIEMLAQVVDDPEKAWVLKRDIRAGLDRVATAWTEMSADMPPLGPRPVPEEAPPASPAPSGPGGPPP